MARKKRSTILTVKQRGLMRVIERYVCARIADSEKGGGDPSSYEEIEQELRDAEQALADNIALVE